MFLIKSLQTFGEYLILMGRTFSRPERMRMFMKNYMKEMSALGVDSIGIVLHRCGDLHTDEAQHTKSVDAKIRDRIHHT